MKKSEIIFSVILVPLDFLMLGTAALAAYFIRFNPTFANFRPVIFELPLADYLILVVGSSLIWILIFASLRLYSMRVNRTLGEEIGRVFVGSTLGFVAVVLALFFQRELFESRFILLAAWILSILLVSSERILIRLVQQSALKRGIGAIRLLLLGEGSVAETLEAAISVQPRWGFVTVRPAVRNIPREIFALEKFLTEAINQTKPDGILVADPTFPRELLTHMREFALDHNLEFRFAADPLATRHLRVRTYPLAGIPLVEFERTPLEGWGRVLKRIFDIVVSLVLIVILSPLLLGIGLAVCLSSGRPIFWSRLDDGQPVTRIGLEGRPFRYFKFRTMHVGTHRLRYTKLSASDTRPGPLVKIKDDPRVTPIGRFLRRWSLDELPELFLVLLGAMSLVGPRPHLPEEVAAYQRHHKRVLAVKPGITGLAQISGREHLSFEEEVTLDEYYIEQWSLPLDFVILVKTPWVVITRPAS